MKTKANKGGNTQSSQQWPATANTSSDERDTAGRDERSELNTTSGDTQSLKAEILSSLRSELAEIFCTELRSMLGDDLSTIKSELQVVKVEFSNTMVSMQSGMSTLKSTVKDMEQYFYLFG